jgi:hypothetical protein
VACQKRAEKGEKAAMNPAFKYSVSVDTMGTRLRLVERKVCVIALGLILLAVSSSYLVFEPATLKWLAQEDGLVENLSALNWLLAAGVMFVLFAKQRNVWFLLLGILFAVCLGEEVSWGQRLIGFSTPESIQANNFQGEFNLHNLNFFERRYGDKGFWAVMRDVGRMFAIFWFVYGIVLPISLKLSGRLRRFVQYIRLPVMPLTIGVFFLINYVVFQYFEDHHAMVCAHLGMINNANCSSLPVEIREWFDSLLFLVFTLVVLAHSFAAPRSSAFDGRDLTVCALRRPGTEIIDSHRSRTASRR